MYSSCFMISLKAVVPYSWLMYSTYADHVLFLLLILFNHKHGFFIYFQVELLIPQLQFLDSEGAQAELWELSRIFLESLIEETGIQVCIIYLFVYLFIFVWVACYYPFLESHPAWPYFDIFSSRAKPRMLLRPCAGMIIH